MIARWFFHSARPDVIDITIGDYQRTGTDWQRGVAFGILHTYTLAGVRCTPAISANVLWSELTTTGGRWANDTKLSDAVLEVLKLHNCLKR